MNSCSIAYEFLCAYKYNYYLIYFQIIAVEYIDHVVICIFHVLICTDHVVLCRIIQYAHKNFFLLEDTNNCFDYNRRLSFRFKGRTQKRETVEYQPFPFHQVGVPRFELGTPCSQSRCANRTALHPVLQFIVFISDCGAKVRLYFKLQNFSVTFFMKNIIFLLSG